MKNIFRKPLVLLASLLALGFVACDDDDNREYQDVSIVGVKVDGTLYTPASSTPELTVVALPAGQDISKNKLQVLVANGELVGFVNNVEYDCRKPLDLSLRGYNGVTLATKLHIQSAPKLTNFVIKGISVPAERVFESATSFIVQLDKGTDLTALEVTMEFINGTLVDFENGIARDYTDPVKFNVLGVDGTTNYPYELVITTEEVGPATINSVTVNGVRSDSVQVHEGVVVPFIPALMDFTNVTVELGVGYGNKVDPAFTGTGLNLMTGDNKVKVTGTNGIVSDFVIGVPQLSFAPALYKSYEALGYAANDLCSVGFSGSYLLAGHYSSATKTPDYFDMQGNLVGCLDADGTVPSGYGFRKFATDSKGNILCTSLGMSDGEQWVYRWDNVTAKGKEYISYSKASLGVDFNPRAGGISIQGDLDGDATVVMTLAQRTDAFVWTVKGGTLDPTPKHIAFPYAGSSYYWSLQPMPQPADGFIGMVTNTQIANAGIVKLDANMQEQFRVSGFYSTGGDVIVHNGRTYFAYTTHNNNNSYMRICDITDGQQASYAAPLFNRVMEVEGGNGNATMDAAFGIVDGKLHVAFCCTNLGLYMYCLE